MAHDMGDFIDYHFTRKSLEIRCVAVVIPATVNGAAALLIHLAPFATAALLLHSRFLRTSKGLSEVEKPGARWPGG